MFLEDFLCGIVVLGTCLGVLGEGFEGEASVFLAGAEGVETDDVYLLGFFSLFH